MIIFKVCSRMHPNDNYMSLILDLLFPKQCVGCGKFDTYFCQSCVGNILQTDLVCPVCEKLAVGGQTHPICRKRYGLDGLWSLGIYQDPLRKAIQSLKYRRVKDLAEVLINIIIEYWAKFQPFVFDQIKISRGLGWAVVPVPLHFWRANNRGFNQSSLTGQLLAKELGLTYCGGLKRIRYTKSQVKLKGFDRHQNIKNAFAIDPSVVSLPQDDKSRSKNHTQLVNCLLIDDVWTTGSTMRECAYILKKAGAKKVWGLTLAR